MNKRQAWLYLLVTISVVLGTMRLVAGFRSSIFKTVAHLFVGYLYGCGHYEPNKPNAYLYMAVGLTLVEILAFVVLRQ